MNEVYIPIDLARRMGVKDGDIVFHGTLQFIAKIDPKLKHNVWIRFKPEKVSPMDYDFDGDGF